MQRKCRIPIRTPTCKAATDARETTETRLTHRQFMRGRRAPRPWRHPRAMLCPLTLAELDGSVSGEISSMKLLNFEVGNERPIFLIAGPCVIESQELTLRTAQTLKELTTR